MHYVTFQNYLFMTCQRYYAAFVKTDASSVHNVDLECHLTLEDKIISQYVTLTNYAMDATMYNL